MVTALLFCQSSPVIPSSQLVAVSAELDAHEIVHKAGCCQFKQFYQLVPRILVNGRLYWLLPAKLVKKQVNGTIHLWFIS